MSGLRYRNGITKELLSYSLIMIFLGIKYWY
jgi:hypothetical protein